jgi:hypothetical protein
LDDNQLFDLLATTRAHEVWLVHSVSQVTLENLMARAREIPGCMAIHVGTDIDISGVQQTIPLIVEQTV